MILFELLATFGLLAAFAGLGALLTRTFQLSFSPIQSLLSGAGAFALLLNVTGPVFSLKWVGGSFLVLGLMLFFFFFKEVRHWPNWMARQLSWPIVIYLCFGFILTLYPSSYFDPLNYHLFGILRWSDLDRLQFISDSIQIMHNSYADYLYFPFSWFFDRSPDGLMSIQVSAQLLTFILGALASSCLMASMLEKSFPRHWIGLLILAVLTRASLQHKAFIAKNDWIAISWFFAALPLYLTTVSRRMLLVAAFFIGLSIGAKFTYVIPAIILFLALHFAVHISKPFLWQSLLMLLVVASPYFLRNFIWTANPFFPMKFAFFTSALGPSWEEGMRFFGLGWQDFNFPSFLNKIYRIFTYEPLVYFFLMSLVLLWKCHRVIRSCLIGIFLVLILFIFGFGPNAEIRHFGPIALAINFFAAWAVYEVLEKVSLSIVARKVIFVAIITSLLINPLLLDNELNPLPASISSGHFFKRDLGLIHNKSGLDLSRVLQGKRIERIGIIDDTPPYYFSRYPVSRLWDDPELDRGLDACEKLGCVLRLLRSAGFTHLIDSGTFFDPYYRPHILTLLRVAQAKNPDIILTTRNGEKIFSIEALKEASPDE